MTPVPGRADQPPEQGASTGVGRTQPAAGRWLWLLRWGFYLLYHQFAWTYDTVAWLVSLGQWRDWGRSALPFLRGPRVLDLAHGPGNLLLDLATAGFQAIGHDLSPAMSRIARRRLLQRRRPARLTRGRAQSLPYPAGAFDSVVSTFPAEFILHPATLSEIRRVLASDGVLVIVPIAVLTGSGLWARLLDQLYTLTGQRLAAEIGPPPHLRQAGFESQVHWVSLPRSRVMVIVSHRGESL